MAKQAPWFVVLEAARKASRNGKRVFTAAELTEESELQGTIGKDGFPVSKPEQIASAWLGKFCRWGYACRNGSTGNGKRWVRTYEMTEYGLKRKPPKRRMGVK